MADTKRKINWRRIIFIASLGFNLLFIGMFAGAAFRIGSWTHDGHGGGERIAGSAYIRALDHDSRHALLGIMRDARRDGDNARNRALYTEAIALLRADNVDEAALIAVMQQHAGLAESRLQNATSVMAAHLAGLDAAKRRAYADRLEDAISRKNRRRR